MDDASFAGQLSVVALLALLIISFAFVGLSRLLNWLANWLARRAAVEGVESSVAELSVEARGGKRAQVAIAAVVSYLEAEKASRTRGSGGRLYVRPKSTTQEGEK